MCKSLQYMGLWVAAMLLGGCPLLNPFLEAPESAFQGSPPSGEAPLTVLFSDLSEAGTTNITEWQWDFGDGSTSMLRNPSHIYTAPGAYTVSLTVTTSVGTHTALRRDYIQVVEKPDADFTAAPVAGGAPLAVSFADTSSPGSAPITAWEWNFGDRTPLSTEQNPNHVYTAPGLYTVTLRVTTAAGTDQETKVQFVNVAGAPVADFTSDFTPGLAPLIVNFTDASAAGTATVLAWAWDFGDGEMSTEQHPAHTYTAPGTYTVSLTVQTTAGQDQEVKTGYIVVEQGPTAAFAGTPLTGSAPLSVSFTDASAAGSQAITRRLWDFGDGGLLSTQTNPTRVYTEPGKYDVSLRVTTAAGADTELKTGYVTVTPGVNFSATPTSGKGSLAVQFSDESELGSLSVDSWAWDFGDGATSAEASPSHTYAAPGVYDVTLSLTTALGESVAVRAGLISVIPDTAFSAAPTLGASPLNVIFKDETAAGEVAITGWLWDFGDGSTSTEQNPTHSYTISGQYAVSLQTTAASGVDTERKVGLIGVKPAVDFSSDVQSGQGALTAKFVDQSAAGNLNILAWHWDFGDGSGSAQQHPTHTYDAIGTYDVTLTITTALGDESVSKAGFVAVAPEVDFEADKVTGAGTLSVKFTDKTDPGPLEIESWIWDFGDGGTSDEPSPSHTFAPGLFTVSLTVVTSLGETTTAREDLIMVAPVVTLAAVQPAGPAPFEASLLDLTDTGAFEVTSRLWDFGDGDTSEEKDPVHIFEEPGKYTVTLTLLTDGGEFSKTSVDFITAQRGPTAAFTQNVVRGGAPTDPVTVSFINLSLPGDSSILNQEWDFGESAIATDEAATEANPTVTYPGTLFDTIPQDVSLTVRTFIAENTLVKENLFDAPVTKSTLPEDVLDDATFTAIATDARGDVWAIGSSDAPLVVGFDANGTQRWGVMLSHDVGLVLNDVHAPGDGGVYVAGTLGKTAWAAHFDGRGELLWEYRDSEPSASEGVGLAARANGTVLLGVRRATAKGEFGLQLIVLDANGSVLESFPPILPMGNGGTVRIATVDDCVLALVGSDNGTSTISRLVTHENSATGVWTTVVTISGEPVAIYGTDDAQEIICAIGDDESSRIVPVVNGGVVETLLNAPAILIALSAGDEGLEASWLSRDGEDGRWKVMRESIGE